jgi:hypothetical protein
MAMLVVLVSLGAVPGSPGATAATAASALEERFQRAASDDAELVPLLIAASREVIALPTEDAIALAERLAPSSRRVYLSGERMAHLEQLGICLVRAPRRHALAVLASRYRCSAELLTLLNPHGPRDGCWKVIDGRTRPITLVVMRAACRLLVWHGRTLVGIFPIATGVPGHVTPLGRTRIRVRVTDPEWRDPASGRIYGPHQDGNFLGGYWLGFAPLADGRFRSIGIHGWTAAAAATWMGRASSHGCVRLAGDDLALVFALAVRGTRVEIRR